MRKAIVASVAFMLSLSVAAPAFAAATTTSGSTTPSASSTPSTSKPGVHARKSHDRTMQGTVSAVSGDSFTLTVHSKDYTVNTSSSTRIKNRKWHNISVADIQVGNKVRVYGSVSGTTVTAQIVRDISLPMASSSSSH